MRSAGLPSTGLVPDRAHPAHRSQHCIPAQLEVSTQREKSHTDNSG